MLVSSDRLTFTARHGERIYLNEDRTRDLFTMQVGAISEWVTKASKELGAGLSVIQLLNVQVKAGGGNDLKYNLTNPVAQALVLQTIVEEHELIKPLDEAKTNDYVLVQGKGCLRHPEAPRMGAAHSPACEPAPAVEEQRATEEAWLRFLRPNTPDARAWLLMVQRPGGGGPAAGVLDQRWLSSNGMTSYASAHVEWTTFGVLQRRVGDTPLIAPVSIFLA